jgi:anti-sigma regulatory factor (Ser/Thr protein kinase)
MEKKFKRTIQSLDEIFDFIGGFVAAHKIDDAAIFSINLAVEELFTNMVKYNPGNANDISIIVARSSDGLAVTLIDTDVEDFDVTMQDEVDVSLPLSERRAGGLGIHLVKKMVDRLDYEYAGRQSRITLIKHLEQ